MWVEDDKVKPTKEKEKSESEASKSVDGSFGSTIWKKSPTEKKPPKKSNEEKAQEEKERGNEAYKKKEFEEAIQHYKEAIRLDPTNAMLHFNMSAVFLEQRKMDLSKRACFAALDIAENNPKHTKRDKAKIFARLAKIEYELKDVRRALILYETSLKLQFDPKVAKQRDECVVYAEMFDAFQNFTRPRQQFFDFF